MDLNNHIDFYSIWEQAKGFIDLNSNLDPKDEFDAIMIKLREFVSMEEPPMDHSECELNRIDEVIFSFGEMSGANESDTQGSGYSYTIAFDLTDDTFTYFKYEGI